MQQLAIEGLQVTSQHFQVQFKEFISVGGVKKIELVFISITFCLLTTFEFPSAVIYRPDAIEHNLCILRQPFRVDDLTTAKSKRLLLKDVAKQR